MSEHVHANSIASSVMPALKPSGGYLLQRKCACGGSTGLLGECESCADKKQNGLQAKLKIGEPGDIYEREADRIADQVMTAPAHHAVSSGPPRIQRFSEQSSGPMEAAPASVDQALASPGKPLEPALRSDMERRFGHDFSRVRVHSDAAAAQSARDVNAHAYTVGQDVVFGAGQYRPGSDSGRHLLSHELAHTIQQRDVSRVQRSCVASGCPPALVPVDALFPRYEAAEKCIQDLYASTHPAQRGISLSYNADWLHLTGGSPNEKMALGCLRGEETPGAGPNFTAKGLMWAAAPDLWDFRNQTMYEITTFSGAAERLRKLGYQTALASSLCGPADCGGLQFDRGQWSPQPPGCFALGGDLYFTARNTNGVIVYSMFKDATKELALAVVLAAMAAALKSMGPKAGAVAAGKAVGGKLIPAYAVASLVAMAVLLSSGRAEAKLGPGTKEPLEQLFEELDKQGTKVPPEIQEMLDANPELKEKMNKAMGKGGDPNQLRDEINKQILDTIAANKDKFSAEELEALLASTQVAGKALPKVGMTVDELKKLAAAVKAGKTGVGGTGGGGDTPLPGIKEPPKKTEPDPKTKDAPAGNIASDQISQLTRDKLAKQPEPVRDLFKGLLGESPHAKKLTDAQVQRFLTMVPPGLTADQVTELLKKRKPVDGETADQVLDSLQAILANLSKPAAPKPEPGAPAKPGDAPADKPGPGVATAPTPAPAPDVTVTTGPTVSGSKKTLPGQLIQELAAKAKTSSFTDVPKGTYRVSWKPEEKGNPTVGSFISGELRGRIPDDTTYVGRVEAEVTAVAGRNLKIKFITSTPMVSGDGTIVMQSDHFVGREDNVVLDSPEDRSKKRKSK